MLPVVQVKESAAVNVAATGDLATFRFYRPAEVVGVKCVLLQAGASNTAFNAAFDLRVTAGSDTGRVAKSTLTVPASLDQGRVIYDSAFASFTVDPGDELIFECINAVTNASHNVAVSVEFIDLPEREANYSGATAA